ncbi:MAG: copper homeostasis protein CutC [Planctomycetota bacterium]
MQVSANARVLVEVAVNSVEGASVAAKAGADRIELCCSLVEGGLSPSLGLVEAVRAAVAVPVVVMVRPRGGDFCYDPAEFDVMQRDVRHLRPTGVDGIVTGILLPSGQLDEARLRELVASAAPLSCTFHRAFDLCVDPASAIETMCSLGIARVLTSGQAASAPVGAPRIKAHVAQAAGRLAVMAGAGVRDGNVAALIAATGVQEVHLSATGWRDSSMTFRRQGVPMGSRAGPNEFALRQTDAAMVARVVAAVRA